MRDSTGKPRRSCVDSCRTSVIAMRVAAVTIVALALVSSASAASVVRTWFPQGDQLRYGVRAVDGRGARPADDAEVAARRARRPPRRATARGRPSSAGHALARASPPGVARDDPARPPLPAADRGAARRAVSPARLRLRVLQLGRTLSQFPGIRRFRLSVSGQLLEQYPDLGLRWHPDDHGIWNLAELSPAAAFPLAVRDRARRRRRFGADPPRPDVPRGRRLARRERGDRRARLCDDAGADGVRGVERIGARRRADARVVRARAAGDPADAAAHRPGPPRRGLPRPRRRPARRERPVSSGPCTRQPDSVAGRRPGRSTSIARSSSRGRCRSRSGCRGPRTSRAASRCTRTRTCPAYPASHGCVRLPAPEAQRVYAFALRERPSTCTKGRSAGQPEGRSEPGPYKTPSPHETVGPGCDRPASTKPRHAPRDRP